ncbi:MAG: Methylenetetrahydrofolate reductase [Bryobacterales bacterium]|nr:Methylenetetrahydrofolate reductase [Bryobacterales bacterium]
MLIRDLLASRQPSISFEFFPPRTDEAAAQLEATIGELRGLHPTFVSVTWGAGGSTRDKTIDIVSRIKRDTGIEAMAHLTCVGSSREDLSAILDRLTDAGVSNVLALRGDPPKGVADFKPAPGGFRYGSELVEFIRASKGAGVSLGAAAYPERHVECLDAAVDLDNLKRKVDAGVDFLITQLFFDNNLYWDFVARARAAGITVPIVPGIMPIASLAQVDRFASAFGASVPQALSAELANLHNDPQAVMHLGVAHATSQCVDLLARGAPGIHFYTMNRSTATRAIYSAIRIQGLAPNRP